MVSSLLLTTVLTQLTFDFLITAPPNGELSKNDAFFISLLRMSVVNCVIKVRFC